MKTRVNNNICGFTADSSFAKLGHNKTVNMYLEATKVENKGVNKVLYGFGGYKSFQSMSGKCRGFHVVENCYGGKPVLFCVFGTKLYSIDNVGTKAVIATIGSGQDKVCFAEVPIYGADSFLVFVDGHNCYAINTTEADGILHNISLPMRVDDTRIEPNCVVYLYGNLVVNDAKTDAFYTSCYHPLNEYDGAVDFDAFMVEEAPTYEYDDDGNQVVKDARPYYKYGYVSYSEYRGDKTLAILSTGNKLFTLGENSLQQFEYNNVALSKSVSGGIVWTCPNTSSLNVGCSTAKSIAQFGDMFFFVGRKLNGNLQVLCYTNGGVTAISNSEMEREMVSDFTEGSCRAFCFMVNGHPFYVLTYGDKTYAWDIRENGWVNLSSRKTDNLDHKFRYDDSIAFNGKVLFGTDNLIAEYTEDDFTDCGTPIVRKRTGYIVADNNILIQELKPIVNTGDCEMELRMNYSSDGKSFKQFVTKYGGAEGDYGFEPMFIDLGDGHNFQVELSTTSNGKFMLKDVELTYLTNIY